MNATDILGLLGGLALFLYGMQMMSAGLEDAAGNRMKQILERLTSNRFLGVAVGAGITAVIQSFFRYHRHGRRFRQLRHDDLKAGGLDYHGRQYRNYHHRTADRP